MLFRCIGGMEIRIIETNSLQSLKAVKIDGAAGKPQRLLIHHLTLPIEMNFFDPKCQIIVYRKATRLFFKSLKTMEDIYVIPYDYTSNCFVDFN